MSRRSSHSRIFCGLRGKLRAASAVILAGIVGLSFLPASVTRSDSSNRALAETPAASDARLVLCTFLREFNEPFRAEILRVLVRATNDT